MGVCANMTDNEIRIAIAEKCGFKAIKNRNNGFGEFLSGALITVAPNACGSQIKAVPDYPNDLNAVHEAEETIRGNPDLWVRWGNELFAVTKPNGDNPFACYHATARQRAEAFCRTLGIWKD